MVFICGAILFNVIINARNANDEQSNGRFEYYRSPYGFFSQNTTTTKDNEAYVFTGDTGRLVGMWSAMNTIFFSLQGFFTVAVTAAENKDLDRDEGIKLATRKISLRVILMYTLFVFTVGLNVPYDDSNLRDYSVNSIRRGQYSAIIIACVRSRITGWPHFVNAFFIFSAFSAGVNALYISSRLLHALANIQNVWPLWANFIKSRLEKTTSKGVPAATVFVSWLFGLLAFLAVQPLPTKILGRMAINSTASMLIVYAAVCVSFLYFKTRTLNGAPDENVVITTPEGVFLNRNARDYPYKSHLQWLRAAYALCGCILLLLFNGWRSFLRPFSAPDFIASYISLFIFVLFVVAYHIKDEREWNPLHWTRRVTLDISNPMVTREKDLRRRKGRLHRANRRSFFSRANGVRFLEYIWVWLK
ncbi:hypothetical protein MMC07_007157 [Pseudocyphellaria aurata]|nr:hypothetical protein [Pseudocyphellaria aurata]